MKFTHQWILETPQKLMHGAGHEQLNTQRFQPHGDQGADEKRVGVHLIHDGLKRDTGELWVSIGLIMLVVFLDIFYIFYI